MGDQIIDKPKTADGQEIVYFSQDQIKCKEMYEGQMYEFYIDHPDGPLEFAEATVDSDTQNIEFYINNNFNRGYVLKGNGFGLTSEVLKRSVNIYKATFGHPPKFLNGCIIKKNLKNFQNEYMKIKSDNPLMADRDSAIEAVKKISFGRERISLGYRKIDVDVKKYETLKLSDGSDISVPSSVRIIAELTN